MDVQFHGRFINKIVCDDPRFFKYDLRKLEWNDKQKEAWLDEKFVSMMTM